MVDEQTMLVPGHGPVSKKADLAAMRDVLVDVNESVSLLLKQGKTADEVAAAGRRRSTTRNGKRFLKAGDVCEDAMPGQDGRDEKAA